MTPTSAGLTLRLVPQTLRQPFFIGRRFLSQLPKQRHELKSNDLIAKFLSKTTWSVRSLLPTEADIQASDQVTPAQLHHLLRLSALPLPSTPKEEEKMLRDLKAQLHFVREIQKVDTDGVEPMKSLRPESAASLQAQEITLETMSEALVQEDVVGTHTKRIRRRQASAKKPDSEIEGWDVLEQAPNKVGRFFVVNATGS